MTTTQFRIVLLCGVALLGITGCAGKQITQQQLQPNDNAPGVCRPVVKETAQAPPKDEPPPLKQEEVKVQPKPADPPPPPEQKPEPKLQPAVLKRFTPLTTIYFAVNSDHLDSAAKNTLDRFAQAVKNNKASAYSLEGFCDERGSDTYNVALGKKRAHAVFTYLVKKGIAGKRLTTASYGRNYPVTKGTSEEAWRLNRRLEIVDAGSPKPGSSERYGKVISGNTSVLQNQTPR